MMKGLTNTRNKNVRRVPTEFLKHLVHMRQKRAFVKLNNVNHLGGESTEISSVGFSDPKNKSIQTDF